MQLSFIIVTHNRRDQLRRCLASLAAQERLGAHEVIVLDNGSSDNTAAMLAVEFPQVTCIESPNNLGVGGGRNRAVQQAQGAWLIFIDDDEYWPHPRAASELLSYINAPDAADAYNLALLAPDGTLFRDYLPRFDKTEPADNALCACLMSGACAIRADVFRALEGFWPFLSPYGFEDRDFMFRLLDAGYCVRYARRAELVHDKAEDTRLNPRWAEFMLAHHSFVALRHLPWRYVLSYVLHGWAYYSYKALRAGQGRAGLRGIARFFRHLPQVLKLRRPVSRDIIAFCQTHSGRLRY